MTDRNERDADLIERVEQTVGMGHAAWDTIDPLEIAAAFREALAAPAEGEWVSMEALRRWHASLEGYDACDVADTVATRGEIKALIDSAGGAKGECCVPDAGEPSFVFLGRDPQAPALVEQWADERERAEPDSAKPASARDIARRMREFKNANPDKGMPASAVIAQPAEGDGAVGEVCVLDHDDDAKYVRLDNEALPAGTKLYTRPAATAPAPNIGVGMDVSSDGIDVTVVLREGPVDTIIHHEHHALAATAVVPEGFVLVPREAAIEMLDAGARHIPDEWPNGAPVDRDDLRDLWDDMLAAAPAAPKGGVVDEAMVFRMAVWMARQEGHDDPHHLIWEGSPPEPWGEVWNRYEDDARAALTAALATGEQP